MTTTALVIMDTWDQYHQGHNFLQTPMERTMTRICQVLTHWNGPVVLSAYQTGEQHDCGPWRKPHDMVRSHVERCSNSYIISWDTDEVKAYLNRELVSQLYYCGFSIPGCIENRPLGMLNMQDEYQCKVVIDCCLNLSSPLFTEADIIHETYRYVITSGYDIVFGEHI